MHLPVDGMDGWIVAEWVEDCLHSKTSHPKQLETIDRSVLLVVLSRPANAFVLW
jgi:hypothetical protein